ncbi:MAG: addiction module protein [Pirellulaceae bacterium]|nr:addiction module protein [Pirellulaceae bacterium]
MSTIDEIMAAVRALPSGDRARLIPLLWEQVHPEDWVAPSTGWLAEANGRSDAIAAGEMPVNDWENVRARARRKAGLSE